MSDPTHPRIGLARGPRAILSLVACLVLIAGAPLAATTEAQPSAIAPVQAEEATAAAPPPNSKAPARSGSADEKPDEDGGFWNGAGAALFQALPTLIWAVVIVWVVAFLAPQLIGLVRRLRVFKGLGLELEFVIEERLAQAARRQGVTLHAVDSAILSARLERLADIVRITRILWVDDQPDNNFQEQALLRMFGSTIVAVTSTDAAMQELRTQAFDVVVTDMKRGDDRQAGLELVRSAKPIAGSTAFIVYTGTDQAGQSRPAGLFGITNRPDELIHLIMDARQRQIG